MSLFEIIDIAKWRLKRIFPKRLRRIWLALFFICVVGLIYRVEVLQSAGNYLIKESELAKADAIFVLGGNTYDRSNKAVELFKEDYADKIITLGANVAGVLRSLGDSLPDALIGREHIERMDTTLFNESNVIPLIEGTSTKEEAEAILNFSLENNYKKVIIVSDKFHTRRISNTFVDNFKDEGIDVMLSGASHSSYDEDYWWKSEVGLIMVNNEYVKIFYYLIKF